MRFYAEDNGKWCGHASKGNTLYFDAVGEKDNIDVMFTLLNMVSAGSTYKGNQPEYNLDEIM